MRKSKEKLILFIFTGLVIILILMAFTKGNQPKVIGYTYDSGNTVWEMAEKHCPSKMDKRDFVREIEKVNAIENHIVYQHKEYKIPIYEIESEYLDMTTVVDYELSNKGVLLLTDNGNGYFIEQ